MTLNQPVWNEYKTTVEDIATDVTSIANVPVRNSTSIGVVNVPLTVIGQTFEFAIEPKADFTKGIPYTIRGKVHSRYTLIRPIQASLLYILQDNVWLITEDLFDEYGIGETISQARRSYINGLIGYYKTLSEWATGENLATQIQFKQLREYLIENEMNT